MAEERLQIRVDEKGALVVKRKLEGVGEGARKAGGGVKLLRTALGGLATIGIGAVMASAVKTMASFSQEMSTVLAITKANVTQFEELQAAARDLGATTRFSATQAAEGMTFLARAGFKTNQVLAAIGPTLQLAQAGALELGRAADIASNVLTGFRIAADDAARVIDVLALAANSANTNVEQLGEAMSYVAPISSSLGVSLETTAAAVQVLSDAGIQGSRAGTNLTMVMRLMEANTKKQTMVLKELNLTSEDVRVSEIGLTAALENLNDAGATTGQIFRFFGRSAAAASVLIEGTTGKMGRFEEANLNAAGTAANVAKVMDDNLNGALLAVKSAWEELQLAFGAQGPQSALTQGLKNLATILRTVAGNIEFATTVTLALAAAFAAIKWSAFLQGITTAAGALAQYQKVALSVQKTMAKFALNPFTIGILALSVAVIALTAAFNKYKKLQDELFAIEEATYKMRLKHVQARVREIQEAKAATKAVADYIAQLELENKFLGMTEEAQTEQVNLFKAMEVAGRALEEGEKKRIITLLEEKAAIMATNERRKEEQELLSSIQQPAAEYAHQLDLLNALNAKGDLVGTQYVDTLAALKDEYGQTKELSKSYSEGLEREIELMKMSNAEREVQQELDAARASGTLGEGEAERIRELVTERQKLKATMDAETQALEYQNEVLSRTSMTQEEYNRKRGVLDELLIGNKLNLIEFNEELKKLDESMVESTQSTASVMEDSWGTLWNNAGSALDDFASGGIVTFKGLADNIIKDLQRIIQKQILIMAFRAVGIPIPGFATGGSFKVGGAGGPDSQLVQFMASPNEQVDVTRPGQQPGGSQTTVQAAPPIIKIINISDAEEARQAMVGVEGEQIVINHISNNPETVKQALA